MPKLCVVSARPVSVSRNGKVKTRKRKANPVGLLGSVTDLVYPGGNKKLSKDATTDPYSRKKKRKPRKRKANAKRTGKKSIYNIHNTSGDQFADVEASSKAEALKIFRRLKGDRPGLRAYKLQGDDIVSRDVIRNAKRNAPRKRKRNGTKKPYKVVSFGGRYQVRENLGHGDWKAYGAFLKRSDAVDRARELNANYARTRKANAKRKTTRVTKKRKTAKKRTRR